MTDRISFAQAVLAAIYASPLMAVPLMLASSGPAGGSLRSQLGPFLVCMVLLWLPTAIANLVARALVGWAGAGSSSVSFHLALGAVAGGVLIWIVNAVARGSANLGGGPLGWPMQCALVIAAACNAGMIYAVWHFGWKSTYD